MKEARILKSFQLLLVSLALSGQIKCHDHLECLEIESGVIAIPAIPTSFFQPEEASNSQTFSRATDITTYNYPVSTDVMTNCRGSTASVHYCYEHTSTSRDIVFILGTSQSRYNVFRNSTRDICNTDVCCSYTELSGFSSPNSFAVQASSGSLVFKKNYTASRTVGSSPLECGGLLLVQIRIETSSNSFPVANYSNVDYCATPPLMIALPSTTVTPDSITSTTSSSAEDVAGVMTTTSLLSSGTTNASVEDVAGVTTTTSITSYSLTKSASINSETVDETRHSPSGSGSVTLGAATRTSSSSSWPHPLKTSADLMSSIVPAAPGVPSVLPSNILLATDSSIDDQGQNGVDKSVLIGGVLGSVLFLLVIIVVGLVALLCRRHRMPNQKTASDAKEQNICNMQTLVRRPEDNLQIFEYNMMPGCTSSDVAKRNRRPTASTNDYDYIVTWPPVTAPNTSEPLQVETSDFYDSVQESSLCNASHEGQSRTSGIYMQPAKNEKDLYHQLNTINMKYLEHDSLCLGNMIGSGNFGDVHRGVWLTNSEEIEVAVKTLKTRAGKTDKIKFLQEAAIMGQFRHPNVVQMYGVALNREPILLVLEFLSRGDLLEQLKLMRSKRMSQVEGDLLNYGCQVACGMKYLSQLGFVHRV